MNPTESGSRDKRNSEDKAMVGENWTSEEMRRLKKNRIDPVRSPPERLKSMTNTSERLGLLYGQSLRGKGRFM